MNNMLQWNLVYDLQEPVALCMYPTTVIIKLGGIVESESNWHYWNM